MKTRPGKKKQQPRRRRWLQSCVRYKEMKGRTVERIEVWSSSEYRCISIRFEDKTDFTVEITPRMAFHALHSDWKTGEMRILRRWPAIEE
jgi:hypothetical protein